jgi:formylglycine-generating enzyme required for sulfatase activity
VNQFESTGNVSPFGAVNMSGNVWEWVQDSWTPNFSWCQTGCSDPIAPSSSEHHVMKGGSWISEEVFLRCSARYHDGQGGFPSFEVGIRCAQDPLP